MHASVRDNLLLARPDATEGELWAALAAAQVADLVASLPDGLETVVGARGHRFSGGEQQRLADGPHHPARPAACSCSTRRPSALDTATERALQRALDELARGRTTITIAHRLSTVRDADTIAVLDHGRLVEAGTHDQLAASGGRYADPGRRHRAGPIAHLTCPGLRARASAPCPRGRPRGRYRGGPAGLCTGGGPVRAPRWSTMSETPRGPRRAWRHRRCIAG